ncbi:hypothetical protein IOQ59_10190 [Pontibacterium sp. N1Y112]|uniref:HEPN AbiJ-N-terminal domain-containing protein n=1 Tax=Pontibacterium sinense TaxID=2781979 RepID=A0A8J7FDC2_9GAMM|nr:hypothetical protein [Pontibacterium sinense]MBE9397629.1 hypothetical protein [Pontibacterium sinense]
MKSFSNRFGYQEVAEAEISIREDAPEGFRGFLVQLAYDNGFDPNKLRDLTCRVLRVRPDPNNWSMYPNIDNEVRELIDNCKWYKVYDLYERLLEVMSFNTYDYDIDAVEIEINEYLVENGIGWKVVEGLFEFRGPDSFEKIVKSSQKIEEESGHLTASKELHEAIRDLSRRPSPDNTGAIQHAMASLECVAREIVGDPKSNLGHIMKRVDNLIPPPLDDAVVKAWGYASENGRHIREGREPTEAEAELIVGLCASVGNYLVRKSA